MVIRMVVWTLWYPLVIMKGVDKAMMEIEQRTIVLLTYGNRYECTHTFNSPTSIDHPNQMTGIETTKFQLEILRKLWMTTTRGLGPIGLAVPLDHHGVLGFQAFPRHSNDLSTWYLTPGSTSKNEVRHHVWQRPIWDPSPQGACWVEDHSDQRICCRRSHHLEHSSNSFISGSPIRTIFEWLTFKMMIFQPVESTGEQLIHPDPMILVHIHQSTVNMVVGHGSNSFPVEVRC